MPLVKLRNLTEKLTERLYKIEIEKSQPVACASASEWGRVALMYDLHDQSIDNIIDEIIEVVGSQGRWRITIYYWSGELRKPDDRRLMGQGESFLYSQNPHGEFVLKLDPIEIDLQDA